MDRIQVGPPIITIHQGSSFMVTTTAGEITAEAQLGLFVKDTRLISSYRVFVDGKPWRLATSAAISYYAARFYFVNAEPLGRDGPIAAQKVELRLERALDGGLHEDFDITNYGDREVTLDLAVEVGSDFADLFEVKGRKILTREIDTAWEKRARKLTSTYRRQDFHRALIYRIISAQSAAHFANGAIHFLITLPPRGIWHACCEIVPVIDGKARRGPRCNVSAFESATRAQRLHHAWCKGTTRIATSNADVQRAYDQSVYDMGALRLYVDDSTSTSWMPAAGVPWFMTVFGRDSLVVSLQNMIVDCRLANGTLKRLAAYQAKVRDDFRDAQPGKIVHELRFGELAHFKTVPHAAYYGTADATILFLILLSETFRWVGEEEVLHEHRDTALRCLEWIDRYGDLDGDGFQEYKTFSEQGYHNMGWKDAGDAVVDSDGTQVDQPIATCELQGLVYAAKLRMAEVFAILGETGTAQQLRSDAETLRASFNDSFWMAEERFYAYALGPDKRQVRSIASNAGQLLWSGIVDPPQRAEHVVARLLAPDMFSGWGVRTLSTNNPAYDPNAYQLGSVWPHDNAFIAAGAKRYGLWQEANSIAKAIFDAATRFQGYRLPELFAGTERAPYGFPVQVLGANIPQAWAAGSIFLLLQAILGITANAPEKTLELNPTLPDWLPDITLCNLKVGGERLTVRFSGKGDRSDYAILDGGERLKVIAGTAPHRGRRSRIKHR